jgi:hypothetical protein
MACVGEISISNFVPKTVLGVFCSELGKPPFL